MTCSSSAGGCAVCGRLPDPVTDDDRQYWRCPTPHTLAKLKTALKEVGGAPVLDETRALLITELDAAALAQLAGPVRERFSRIELEDSRALALPRGREPGFADGWAITSLAVFLGRHEGEALARIIRAGRLSVHFQPIVEAVDPARLHAHEALLRCRDEAGAMVSAPRILAMARAADMLFQLDFVARRAALCRAAEVGIPAGLFVNFTPTVVYDPDYCLKSTIALVEELGLEPGRITFEVVESEEMQDIPTLRRTLDTYRSRGFNVALDDLGSGFASLNLLHNLRPDIVKLDMELIRGIDHDGYKAAIAGPLLEAAARLGVRTVAEGIETEAEFRWLRDAGATYLQGYLFGRPEATPSMPIAMAIPLSGEASPRAGGGWHGRPDTLPPAAPPKPSRPSPAPPA